MTLIGPFFSSFHAEAPITATLRTGLPDYMKFIQVNGLRFDPLSDVPTIPASLAYDGTNLSPYYIVQLGGPVTPEMKSAVQSVGVKILYYLSYNAFIVRGDAKSLQATRVLPFVRWVGVVVRP